MDWIKSIAPLLGTALAGPLGGAAASFLADKLGVQEATVKAVATVLNDGKLSPEQLVAVKQAELDFQTFLETNKINLEQVHAADRASARDMQAATKSAMPAVLTVLLTFGFFGVLGAMFAYPEVKESAPLMIMLGSLGTAWTGACAFWFGTTSSSAIKTELLARAQPVK